MNLLLHNLGYIVSTLFAIILGTTFLFRGIKKKPNILYFLNNFTFAIFAVTYLLAVNESNSLISRNFLVFNLINLFTVCFTAHLAFTTFGKEKEQRRGLYAIYTGACLLFLFFITDISRYVLPSKPILYFPNFYNQGSFYWLFTTFFLLVAIYFFHFLFRLYFKSDRTTKIRIKYFAISFAWGYGIGSLGFLPVFGITFIDPAIPSLLGLYTIPLAYGSLKYDVLEVGVIARSAALYSFVTAIFGILIILINVLNNYFIAIYPRYPFWLVPFLSAVLVASVCIYIWRHIREADILKYEFINNISHKFRTPLTHIKWAASELRTENDPIKRDQTAEKIEQASMRLFELTNIVIDVARDDNESYQYKLDPMKLEDVVIEIYEAHKTEIQRREQKVELNIDADLPSLHIDRTRIQFALQILFENALIYTPKKGTILVSVKKVGNEVVFSIKDDGIGIDPADIEHLFAKFYRAKNARHIDTEGMGIGLFMTRSIIEKHDGRIWVQSEGEGKGSTFSFALPISRS